MKKEVSPIVMTVVVIVVLGLVAYFGFRAAQPAPYKMSPGGGPRAVTPGGAPSASSGAGPSLPTAGSGAGGLGPTPAVRHGSPPDMPTGVR